MLQAMDLWGDRLRGGHRKMSANLKQIESNMSNLYLVDIHLHIDLNRSDIWKLILVSIPGDYSS